MGLALTVAAALQNDPNFPGGAAEIAGRLGWPARRLNPALAYLVERKLVQDFNFIGGGANYICYINGQQASLTTSIKRIVLRDPSRVWLVPLKVVQPQSGDDPQQLAAEAREIVGEALRKMRNAR